MLNIYMSIGPLAICVVSVAVTVIAVMGLRHWK